MLLEAAIQYLNRNSKFCFQNLSIIEMQHFENSGLSDGI